MLEALLVAEALPEDVPEVKLTSVAVSALLAGSCVAWFWILARWRRGEAIVATEPRRPVPWRGVEVVLIIGFLMALTIGGAVLSPREDKPLELDDFATTFLVGAGFNIALAAVVGMLLAVVRGADGRDLGLVPKLPDDLVVGGVGWLAALVPVYALQVALVYLVADERQTHPLIETLVESRRIDVMLVAVFAAVIVAPIVEEFFFRVVLQGWLEKRIAPEGGVEPVAIDAQMEGPDATAPCDALGPLAPVEIETPWDAFRAPQVDLGTRRNGANGVADGVTSFRGWRGILPVGISSFLFAAGHAGTWPDPLPLFVLALVLGYVYRQTHRLWPSVVLHMLFNGLSLAVVWFGVD